MINWVIAILFVVVRNSTSFPGSFPNFIRDNKKWSNAWYFPIYFHFLFIFWARCFALFNSNDNDDDCCYDDCDYH